MSFEDLTYNTFNPYFYQNIQQILKDGGNPSYKNDLPLRYAVKIGDFNAVKLLLEQSSVRADSENNYCIKAAVYFEFREIVNLLLKRPEVDPTSENHAAIYIAIANPESSASISIAKKLLLHPKVDLKLHNVDFVKTCLLEGNREILRFISKNCKIAFDKVPEATIVEALEKKHIRTVDEFYRLKNVSGKTISEPTSLSIDEKKSLDEGAKPVFEERHHHDILLQKNSGSGMFEKIWTKMQTWF